MNFYRQCELRKFHQENNLEFYQIKVAWIPEEFAKPGRIVGIKVNDIWDEGWSVVEVGSRAPEDQVFERSQDYKRTRKASDI